MFSETKAELNALYSAYKGEMKQEEKEAHLKITEIKLNATKQLIIFYGKRLGIAITVFAIGYAIINMVIS